MGTCFLVKEILKPLWEYIFPIDLSTQVINESLDLIEWKENIMEKTLSSFLGDVVIEINPKRKKLL